MSLFVTFEGPEGSGKSTQARLLYSYLHARGYPVILVREPGGTRIGDLIRRIVLDLQHTEMADTTEMLLFSAARAQLVNEVIRPYLEQGGIVLCDRYADSTYAYQGYGLGRDMNELRTLTAIATGGLLPDVTIYLDLTADEGLERKRRKRQEQDAGRAAPPLNLPSELPRLGGAEGRGPIEWNRLDAREVAYHRRVAEGYRKLIAQEPERWRAFDACQAIDALAGQIAGELEPWLEHIQMLETTTPDTQ
ncbi:MAG TPA: dTMP kinase [Kouleothrix sp.]|uniref:dTMP kinase n=1 Tax=Kouleothrix sp. TaxID=2779161 RepID=UPI002CB6A2AB|nr:dTMP kinase [Kouleothrix sp.]